MKDENGHLYERIETLYVSEEYKVFLLTGQQDDRSGRRAYVLPKPFHTFTPEALGRMKAQASPCEPVAKSRISLVTNSRSLMITDRLTGTSILFPLKELDDDVKTKLSYTGAAEGYTYTKAWNKYAELESVATDRDINVGKPLQVRKPGRLNL